MSSAGLPAAIVFDFDLTLVNSLQGFVASHAYASQQLGLQPPRAEAVARTIGTPLPQVFERLHGEANAALMQDYLRFYQARADEVMTELTVWLDGAIEAVRRLRAAGIRLGIVSQKLRYRIEDVLERARQRDQFAVLLGGDDVPELKPDPRGLLLAVERLGATAATALYVGDTTIDAEAARRAGIGFVAVLTGATARADFAPYRCLHVLDGVVHLPDALGF